MSAANTTTRLILASASPRRAELMRNAGYAVEIIPSTADEPPLPPQAETPAKVAEQIALFKARDIAAAHANAVVIGADTIVAASGRLIGKPRDESDARRILTSLFDTHHEVITGVAIITPGGRAATHHARSRLHMRGMNPEELDEYMAGGDWHGKAGAYGIQDSGDRFVTLIDGSWSNVVGLPMELVGRLLTGLGVESR